MQKYKKKKSPVCALTHDFNQLQNIIQSISSKSLENYTMYMIILI